MKKKLRTKKSAKLFKLFHHFITDHKDIIVFYFLYIHFSTLLTKLTLFIIFVISVAILSHTTAVKASRLYMLCEGFGNVNNLERSSSVYEKAKNYSMACLLERLPSGPSPGGIGH